MKILFIHNKYGVLSGEEVMINRIVTLLQHHDHDVRCFFKNSANIGDMWTKKTFSFFSGIYSHRSRREVHQMLRDFQPHLVQIQNLYPLISPSILSKIRSHSIPIVMRVSNYRLICPNGLFLSHGRLCEKCRSGKEYWCLLRNCENNFIKSFGYAIRSWVARKMRFYRDNVTYYYAQTKFQKQCLVDEGYPSKRISIIPNMIQADSEETKQKLGNYIGYVGRISSEKGILTLIEAAHRCSTLPFKFAGDYHGMPELVYKSPSNTEFLGFLDRKELKYFYQNCRILIFPSIWFEGFPNVLLEAMLNSIPIICSRIGGLLEIVDEDKTGLLFEPGNPDDLAKKITYLWEKPDDCQKMGTAGRDKVLNEYSSEKYYDRLMKIYKKAIAYHQQNIAQAKM